MARTSTSADSNTTATVAAAAISAVTRFHGSRSHQNAGDVSSRQDGSAQS
jgi:hypothetical protein